MASKKNLSELKKNKNKKGEKNIFVTFLKVILVAIFCFIEIAIVVFLYSATRNIYVYAHIAFEFIKLITVLYLLYRHDSGAYKISWIIFIMFLPVVGIVAFYLWGNSKMNKNMHNEYDRIRDSSMKYLPDSSDIKMELKQKDLYKYNQVQYMTKVGGYPIYRNNGTKYYDIGEEFFKNVLIEMNRAKKYIFIQFYILSSGKLWDKMLNVLKDKVKDGVEVNIIVDSLGCIFKLPKNFEKDMKAIGINVYKFNPISPIIHSYLNYRDHRKIIVIDGVVAYTGGVNIADEYVNFIERFGYWKDVGIKLIGDSTRSFTMMFLRNIEIITRKKVEYTKYLDIEGQCLQNKGYEIKQGYVLPYDDGPNNRKNPAENSYIQSINYAKDTLYITTPYFVPSETLLDAILNSARSGVDVKIILPYIPDKKIVNMVTKSYYEVLLEAGVKVYEYTPGFIHSKTLVVDDDTAIVGSTNFDFRSMHLNFECSVWLYETGEEKSIKSDFNCMLKECKEISLEEWKKRPIYIKWAEAILTAFAPMI